MSEIEVNKGKISRRIDMLEFEDTGFYNPNGSFQNLSSRKQNLNFFYSLNEEPRHEDFQLKLLQSQFNINHS